MEHSLLVKNVTHKCEKGNICGKISKKSMWASVIHEISPNPQRFKNIYSIRICNISVLTKTFTVWYWKTAIFWPRMHFHCDCSAIRVQLGRGQQSNYYTFTLILIHIQNCLFSQVQDQCTKTVQQAITGLYREGERKYLGETEENRFYCEHTLAERYGPTLYTSE